MTREEILKGYSNRRIRDSWAALGSNIIKPNTKIYNEGIIYKLEITDSSLTDGLLYCKSNFADNLKWSEAQILDSFSGEITFGNNIIDPNFIFLLSSKELNEITEPIDENFIPFQEELSKITSVKISDEDYELCIRCLGAPFIREDELEYTRDQITDLAIRPALERYYKWFPRFITKTYTVTGDVQEEPFPDGAYDIVGFSVQQGVGGIGGMGNVSHILWRYLDEMAYGGGWASGLTGNYNGTNPPYTQTSNANTFILGRAASQAFINYSTRYRCDKILKTDDNGITRYYARFHSNKGTLAQIDYAIEDLDFNKVEFARRPELIKLCNAEVKKLFGNLRSQMKTDINGVVDYKNWISDADREIDEVNKEWMSMVKMSSLIRGSL